MYNSRPRVAVWLVRPAIALVLTAAVLGITACSDTFRAAAANPAAAATAIVHADQMFEGFAVRFSPNQFDAKYNTARMKLAQSALVPSRIFDDTSVWTGRPTAASRALYISGTIGTDGKYHLDTRPGLTPAARTGDSRHVISLEQVGSNQFRWETRVELAIGSVTGDEVANALTALLRAPEGRTEKDVRDDYRTAFPRATAAFGRGFSLDSVHVAPAALGATSVTLRFGFHPELMKAAYPDLSAYLDKYLGPAKYHIGLGDRSGAAVFDIVGRDRSITLRYRVQQGRLVTLLGPPRPWPDTLLLSADVSLKVKMFTVGFHELSSEFVISNSASGNGHEHAWTMIAQREPKWDLPFLTERLIKSPLRRPFEGQGAMFRMAVRDSAGTQSLFSRRARLDVQESAIMRFIGSLASRAIGDLDDRVELDEHRFMRDGFVALQADLRAMVGRPLREIQ